MRAQQMRKSAAHPLKVERQWVMKLAAAPKYIRYSVAIDRIPVCFADGAAAGMKLRRHGKSRLNHDIVRESGVQRHRPAFSGNAGSSAEIRNLASRMHAGVGSSRSRQLDPFPRQYKDRLLDFVLDRIASRLTLKAIIIRPVVTDNKTDVLHAAILPPPLEKSGYCAHRHKKRMIRIAIRSILLCTVYYARSTSSRYTIGAESPRRGPSFRMRVYPPGRSA